MYSNYEFTPDDLFSGYLRKSQSDDPNEPIEVTLAKHKQRIIESAARLGIKEEQIEWFEEVVSGDTIAERPQIQKMLHKVSDGYFRGTLVVAVDRFSRGDSIDQGIIDQTYYYSGTLIISPEKVYDITNNEMDREQLEFGLFMSKREYNLIKKRMLAGRTDNAKAGYFVSSTTPYGYDKKRSEDKRGYILVPDEYESKIVKLMFDMYAEGVGTTNLAKHLNEIKAKARKSPTWTPAMVRNILKSPVYYGMLYWQRRKTTKKMIDGTIIKKIEYQKQYDLYQGKHEPLITKEQFDLVQERLKSNSSKKVPTDRELRNPLAGLIICGYCLEHFNFERNMFRRPYFTRARTTPVRTYELDKEELLQLLYKHKTESGLSYSEIAKKIGVPRSVLTHWITPNIERFFPSKQFSEHWFEMKKVLGIKTNKFDKAITTFEDDESVHIDTFLCISPECKNVSSDLYLVENRLIELIKAHLTNYKYILDNYEKEIVKVKKKNNDSLKIIDKEIKKLETRLDSVMEAYELKDYTRDQFLKRKNEIESNLEALHEKRNKIVDEQQEDKMEKIIKAIPILEKCVEKYDSLEPLQKNQLLKLIVKKAIYTKKNNSGRWNESARDSFTLEVDFKI